jgi:hypothetical protein
MGTANVVVYEWLGAQQQGIVAGGCYQPGLGNVNDAAQQMAYQQARLGYADFAAQQAQYDVMASAAQFEEMQGINKHRAQALHAADELLRSHLTEEQRRDLETFGWFEVQGKWRRPLHRSTWHRFRIYSGGSIREVKRSGGIKDFCIIALETLPSADVMLTLKLLVESDLNRFYKTARPLSS